ncbi:MAG TPA: hypothetical protein VF817_02255 [Patescibacteria group bacterium]
MKAREKEDSVGVSHLKNDHGDIGAVLEKLVPLMILAAIFGTTLVFYKDKFPKAW